LRFTHKNSGVFFDFFTVHHDGEEAGMGIPAKSRAPATAAGWAPRISQKPDLGARLFS